MLSTKRMRHRGAWVPLGLNFSSGPRGFNFSGVVVAAAVVVHLFIYVFMIIIIFSVSRSDYYYSGLFD